MFVVPVTPETVLTVKKKKICRTLPEARLVSRVIDAEQGDEGNASNKDQGTQNGCQLSACVF